LYSRALSLRNAIALGSIILALFGITAAVGLILMSTYLNDATQNIKEAVDSIVASEELQIDLLEHNRQQLLFEYTGDAAHASRRDEAEQRLKNGIEIFGYYVDSDVEKELVSELKDLIHNYLASQNKGERDQALLKGILSDSVILNEITTRIRRLIHVNQEQAQKIKESAARRDRIGDVLGFGVIAALLMALILLVQGTRTVIYKPLIALQDTVKRLGKGDLKARAHLQGPVELREVASVFNEMAENLENNYQNQHRFLAAVAHDLRNPIAAIKMSMDVIATTRQGLSPEIQQITEIVRRQSDQLNQMVGDLLDRTRIEAGELTLHLEEHDLRESAGQAVRLYQSLSKEHPIHLQLPEDAVLCRCDPTRIGQVLNNLLSNAIKYSPYGGMISVRILKEAQSATMHVSDQGMGIAPEECERIFEPFKRSKSTRDSIPGVGLGLSVSRRLIEAHGGRIRVTSEVGRGSTFTVSLPLAVTPQAS
jgi:signal transduction histidine kinase